jgi:hypothetical protein
MGCADYRAAFFPYERSVMKIIAIALLLVGCAAAQEISPVIGECGLKCSGEFTIRNLSTKPLITTISVFSFSMKDGKPVQRELDKTTQVKLNEMSARLSPLGSHTFSYKLFCDTEPCMTKFVAGFIMGRTNEGVEVIIHLPTTVYSCQKAKDCRKKALAQ